MIEKIIVNAELVISQFQELTDFEFTYNEASVEWLDGYINRKRERDDFTVESAERLADVFGSFLGQCLIEMYGGEWQQTENGWAVAYDDKNGDLPFNKILKQFKNGPEDSIYSFFTSVPIVFKDVLNKPNEIK